MLAIYAVPAVIFFGTTIAAVRVSNKNTLLPIERGAWILPGLVYTFVPVVFWKLEISGPPKDLLNLIDPCSSPSSAGSSSSAASRSTWR